MLTIETLPGNGEREARRIGELDFSLHPFPEHTEFRW